MRALPTQGLGSVCGLCLAACALAVRLVPAAEPAASNAAPATTPARAVVLSELSFEPLPGAAGSWVEIYNRGDDEADLSAARLVCSGQDICRLPDPLRLPGTGLLLIRFVEPAPGASPVRKTPANSFVLEVGAVRRETDTPSEQAAAAGAPAADPLAPPLSPIEAKRRPGFLALHARDPGGQRSLLDYVRWGPTPLLTDQAYVPMAVAAGAWQEGGGSAPVDVGIGLSGRPTLQTEGVLVRLSFDPVFDAGWAWYLIAREYATPGRGNTVLPSPLTYYGQDGDLQEHSRGLSASYLSACPIYTTGMGPLQPGGRESSRRQIAKDPHFHLIVAELGFRDPIPQGRLPPGRYYVRARVNYGTLESPWTEPMCIELR